MRRLDGVMQVPSVLLKPTGNKITYLSCADCDKIFADVLPSTTPCTTMKTRLLGAFPCIRRSHKQNGWSSAPPSLYVKLFDCLWKRTVAKYLLQAELRQLWQNHSWNLVCKHLHLNNVCMCEWIGQALGTGIVLLAHFVDTKAGQWATHDFFFIRVRDAFETSTHTSESGGNNP